MLSMWRLIGQDWPREISGTVRNLSPSCKALVSVYVASPPKWLSVLVATAPRGLALALLLPLQCRGVFDIDASAAKSF